MFKKNPLNNFCPQWIIKYTRQNTMEKLFRNFQVGQIIHRLHWKGVGEHSWVKYSCGNSQNLVCSLSHILFQRFCLFVWNFSTYHCENIITLNSKFSIVIICALRNSIHVCSFVRPFVILFQIQAIICTLSAGHGKGSRSNLILLQFSRIVWPISPYPSFNLSCLGNI